MFVCVRLSDRGSNQTLGSIKKDYAHRFNGAKILVEFVKFMGLIALTVTKWRPF